MAHFLKPVDADLVISGNLLYANVATRNVGINTASPTSSLQVVGNAVVGNIVATGALFATISTTTANITSATFGTTVSNSATINGNVIAGNISATGASFSSILAAGLVTLGPITNVKITGGIANNVIFTDGAGNLSFGNIGTVIAGNAIPLGANSVGSLSTALNIPTTSNITDAIASLNLFLGNITSIRGASTGILYATNLYGQLANASQPLITTLANVTIGNIVTSNIYMANGAPLISTVIASDPSIVQIRSNATTSNASVVNYVNTLVGNINANVAGTNAAIISNVAVLNANIAGANAAIIAANVYATSHADTLNAAMVANITAANAAIAFANTSIYNTVTYVNNLNSAMASNVASANAAIVTANNAVVSYVNTLNANMASNVAGANAAIVTANNAVVSYVNAQIANIASYITSEGAAINTINANVASLETYANATFISGNVKSVYAATGNVSIPIDTFNSNVITTAEYLIQATYQSNFGLTKDVQSTDMLVVTNGTTVLLNEYATLSTSPISLFVPYTTIINGIVSVGVTSYYGNVTIDIIRMQATSRL